MSNQPKVLFFSGSAWHSRELNNIRFSNNRKVTQPPDAEQPQVVTADVNASKRQTLQWVSALIGFLFTALEGLIGLWVLLKLMDANSEDVLVSSVYNLTGLFLAPFNSLMGNPAVGSKVLELTSIIAIIGYVLIAWGIIRLVWLLFYKPSSRTVTPYERD